MGQNGNRTERLPEIRLTPDEARKIDRAIRKTGMTKAAWIRRSLMRAAVRQLAVRR